MEGAQDPMDLENLEDEEEISDGDADEEEVDDMPQTTAVQFNANAQNPLPKVVSICFPKGGVCKTTDCFHIADLFQENGKQVLIVDLDPQATMTSSCLGNGGYKLMSQPEDEFFTAYEVFQRLVTKNQEPGQFRVCHLNNGVMLLPGNMRLWLLEEQIATAVARTSGNIEVNVPGSLVTAIRRIGRAVGADIVIIDTNPAVSAMNRVVLMGSDYFFIGAVPEYGCVYSMQLFHELLFGAGDGWLGWQKRYSELSRGFQYPFPAVAPKFLGLILQNFPLRKEATMQMPKQYQKQKDSLTEHLANFLKSGVAHNLVPAHLDPALFVLALIPTFNSLKHVWLEQRQAVFSLSDETIKKVFPTKKSFPSGIKQRDRTGVAFRQAATRMLQRIENGVYQ